MDKLTHLLYQEWETRGQGGRRTGGRRAGEGRRTDGRTDDGGIDAAASLCEVCYRFIFPPLRRRRRRRRCKILSLVIFLLYLISGSSCSCSPLLSSPLLYSPLPFVIPPHPRGGRRRCSESVAARSFVPPRHYRSYSWDFRVDLQRREKKNEYRPELREWTEHFIQKGRKRTEGEEGRDRREERRQLSTFAPSPPLSNSVIWRLRDFKSCPAELFNKSLAAR